MRIGLCDDNTTQLNYLSSLINEWSTDNTIPCSLQTYHSSEEMLFINQDSFPFDIVILDIQMGAMNGMELAKKIRSIDQKILIVFLTGVKEYVFEGYVVGALRYLLKPIKKEELFSLLDAALTMVGKEKHQYYVYSFKGENIKINHNDILYLESLGHYVIIHTVTTRHEFKKSINELVTELNNPLFIPTHRSYVVNLHHVEKITKNDCILTNEQLVPISKSHYQNINEAFIKHYRGEYS